VPADKVSKMDLITRLAAGVSRMSTTVEEWQWR
jgi:hypothetical protein